MHQPKSTFGIESRLTPELFDHYVAKARAERAAAIAGFFTRLAAWLSRRRAHGERSRHTRLFVGSKPTG
jgi:hypothetical protein